MTIFAVTQLIRQKLSTICLKLNELLWRFIQYNTSRIPQFMA